MKIENIFNLIEGLKINMDCRNCGYMHNSEEEYIDSLILCKSVECCVNICKKCKADICVDCIDENVEYTNSITDYVSYLVGR